jgi:hypothetical protein
MGNCIDCTQQTLGLAQLIQQTGLMEGWGHEKLLGKTLLVFEMY